MVTLPMESLAIGMVIIAFLGGLAVIVWSFMYQEDDDLDDLRRKKAIKEIEDEIDRLKKS